MFRLFQWECGLCGSRRDNIVSFAQGGVPVKQLGLHCLSCEQTTLHDRLISLTAKYLGDRPLSPMVYGGRFDTGGAVHPPKLPPRLPADATADDYMHRWRSKEFQECKSEVLNTHKENRAKRKRADLIKQGATIDLRKDKLPGDPKVAA